jgi:hypothetical protein
MVTAHQVAAPVIQVLRNPDIPFGFSQKRQNGFVYEYPGFRQSGQEFSNPVPQRFCGRQEFEYGEKAKDGGQHDGIKADHQNGAYAFGDFQGFVND